MKIATGNRINEFWQELKGVLVPKEKVLKTIEEIEANTNEENIAGATALKAVNNKLMFPDGTEFYLDEQNGERGYNTSATRGADTFVPFSNIKKINSRASVQAYSFGNNNGAAAININNLEPGKTYICFVTGCSANFLEWHIEAPHSATTSGMNSTFYAGVFKPTQSSYYLGTAAQYSNVTIILWKVN